MLGLLFTKIKNKIIFDRFAREFRAQNTHNFTTPASIFNLQNVRIGRATYGAINVLDYGNSDAKVSIGNFCSIASGVKFLSGGGHFMNNFSTYPFYAYFSDKSEQNTTKGEIVIGDDVWIGIDSLICSGANVPNGCIVGARSVVRGSFEPYSIIIGNPAKCVKKRFSKEIIEILEAINFNNLDKEIISNLIDKFYLPLNENLATELVNQIRAHQ